mgnify:CR=1 FL=1
MRLALSFKDGVFGAVSGVCNHAGGPLGEGRLDGDYIVCPWHNWKFHRSRGVGEPGFEEVNTPDKTAEITLVIGKRFIVNARGKDVAGIDPVRMVLERMDFGKLTSAK